MFSSMELAISLIEKCFVCASIRVDIIEHDCTAFICKRIL